MTNPQKTNVFLVFTNADCLECRRGATQLALLSQKMAAAREDLSEIELVTGPPKIFRVDCSKDPFLCDSFGAKYLPYMLLVQEHQVYRYNSDLER